MFGFNLVDLAVGALGGAVASVVSAKVYNWVKTKIVAEALALAAKASADIKKL